MKLFKARRQSGASIGALYLAIVAQARQPEFYKDWLVPDTVEGRFELVALHTWLVLRRLRHAGRDGTDTSQGLLDYMFDDLDRSIREIGVGDMSIGKYMKRLGKSFYGRAAAYDKCVDAADHSQLAEAVRRNILATSDAGVMQLDEASHGIAGYILDCDRSLATQNMQAMMAGAVTFIQLSRQAA